MIALLATLTACEADSVRSYQSDNYPQRLSDWGLISLQNRQLKVSPEAQLYSLNTALFSDYALKLRTVYLPPGQQAKYRDYETFEFPAGTIISKSFVYPIDDQGRLIATQHSNKGAAPFSTDTHRLMETRLLVKQHSGWDALPYIWRGDDAYLSPTGGLQQHTLSDGRRLNYLIPSKNQCATCHATNHTDGKIRPIGAKARHLNLVSALHGENQLEAWVAQGLLTKLPDLVPANAQLDDSSASLEHRARSYLDINCGHCHNPQGAADTSGLLLDYQAHSAAALGVCKPPIAAGRGSGGRLYSIVPGQSNASIISFRLASDDPAIMMPELGRSLAHDEGVAIVNEWIDSLEGQCL